MHGPAHGSAPDAAKRRVRYNLVLNRRSPANIAAPVGVAAGVAARPDRRCPLPSRVRGRRGQPAWYARAIYFRLGDPRGAYMGSSTHRGVGLTVRIDAWQHEVEDGSGTRLGFHPDPPPVRLHYGAGDPEAEAHYPPVSLTRLPEGGKDVRQMLSRNAGSTVAHRYLQPLSRHPPHHLHVSAIGSELAGVATQVRDHLVESARSEERRVGK